MQSCDLQWYFYKIARKIDHFTQRMFIISGICIPFSAINIYQLISKREQIRWQLKVLILDFKSFLFTDIIHAIALCSKDHEIRLKWPNEKTYDEKNNVYIEYRINEWKKP